jgi:hypothetical protein
MLNKAKVQLKKVDKENDSHNLNIQLVEADVHLNDEKGSSEHPSPALKSLN